MHSVVSLQSVRMNNGLAIVVLVCLHLIAVCMFTASSGVGVSFLHHWSTEGDGPVWSMCMSTYGLHITISLFVERNTNGCERPLEHTIFTHVILEIYFSFSDSRKSNFKSCGFWQFCFRSIDNHTWQLCFACVATNVLARCPMERAVRCEQYCRLHTLHPGNKCLDQPELFTGSFNL